MVASDVGAAAKASDWWRDSVKTIRSDQRRARTVKKVLES